MTALTQVGQTVLFAGKLKIVAAAVMTAAAILIMLLSASGAIASRRQTKPSPRNAEAGQIATKADAENDEPLPVVGVGPWIKGVVVDTSGRPVGGARVSSLRSFQPRSVYSKPNGTFVIAADDPSSRYSAVGDSRRRGAAGDLSFPRSGDRHQRRADPGPDRAQPARAVTVAVADARGRRSRPRPSLYLTGLLASRRVAPTHVASSRWRAGRRDQLLDHWLQAGRRLRLLRELCESAERLVGATSSAPSSF